MVYWGVVWYAKKVVWYAMFGFLRSLAYLVSARRSMVCSVHHCRPFPSFSAHAVPVIRTSRNPKNQNGARRYKRDSASLSEAGSLPHGRLVAATAAVRAPLFDDLFNRDLGWVCPLGPERANDHEPP